jgi:hypothetical protein
MLIGATALSLGLMVSPLAIAQTTQSPPAAQSPGTAQPQWYSHQADEMRASKLIGTNVKNDANETIGSINELVLGKDGKVAAVVIGVGGFLGIGEREVAVDFGSMRLSRDTNGNTVAMLNATKDSLKAAPAWTWASDRNGAARPSATRPVTPDTTRK